MKGGAGLASLLLDQGQLGKGASRGVNILGGLGYCWWLGRSFNLWANLEVDRSWYEHGPDSTQTVNVFLGFDWF